MSIVVQGVRRASLCLLQNAPTRLLTKVQHQPLAGANGKHYELCSLDRESIASMEPLAGANGKIDNGFARVRHALTLQWSRWPEPTVSRYAGGLVNDDEDVRRVASMEPLAGANGKLIAPPYSPTLQMLQWSRWPEPTVSQMALKLDTTEFQLQWSRWPEPTVSGCR